MDGNTEDQPRSYPEPKENLPAVKKIPTGVHEELKRYAYELGEANNRLAVSEARYRGMFENMQNIFSYYKVVVDREGRPVDLEYLSVNPAFEEAYGVKADAVAGRRFSEVFLGTGQESSGWIETLGKVAITGQATTFEQNVTGNARWYRVAAYSPQAGCVAAIFGDITENKRTEEALRESELKYRLLFENINDAIFLFEVDSEGVPTRICQVNEVACRRLGYSREELLELNLSDIDPFFTPGGSGQRQMCSKDGNTYERTHRAKDGTLIPVEISAGNFSLGGTSYRLAFARDMTERKRAERLLKTSYGRMRRHHLVNELIRSEGLPEQKVYETLVTAGLTLSGPLTCCLLIVEEWQGKPGGYWRQRLEDLHYLQELILDLLEEAEDWIAWRSPDGIGILHSGFVSAAEGKKYQEDLAEQLRQKVEGNIAELTVAIGISELATALVGINTRYKQCSIAVNLGHKLWPQRKLYHYLDMGMLQVLPYIKDQEQVTAYIERNLGSLLRYDRRKKTVLLLTLEAILENNNLKAAAEKLFVHQKTLEFRRRRIEQILGVSLDNFETRLVLATALKLLKIM